MYRVLVVDDEHLIRSSLTSKIERFSEETKRARREVQGLRGDINSLPSGGAVTSNFGV